MAKDELVESIIESIEFQTLKKIVHISVEDRAVENELDAVVLFFDGSRLKTQITCSTINGKLALRIRGNYF